jgi:hypothetical protein
LNCLADIDRPTKGFFRRRIQLGNRFHVRWGKKTENRIAPPKCRDGGAIVSRNYKSKKYDESILSAGTGQSQAITTRATFEPLKPFSFKKGTWLKAKFPLIIHMVPKGGLEPPRVSPPPPQEALPFTRHSNPFTYRLVTTVSG